MGLRHDETLRLEVTRKYEATAEMVFDAWLTPDWCHWLAPRDVTCTVLEMNPVKGGRYRLRMMMPEGRAVHIEGEYREISRPERLVLTWRRENDPSDTVLTVQLTSEGHATKLVLTQLGFENTELRDRHIEGWGGTRGSLDKLAAYLHDRRQNHAA